ncbi:FUSC family protein [Streptomyces capitiformicae]|nr:FUSC family protein [Streptomyces capitiformicae]
MFMAPDPGLLRLRVSLRAVLGIALAVTLSELAGLSLTASITGGLAALLALFTVADPTVRGQAVTTALLPAVGFPALALATVLHETPTLRDAVWLAVIFCGVYARRWGPRGHALGIFAFMTFFVTQFLHAVPAQLPDLYTAMTLSLVASSAVRFGAWCIERRTPPPAAPAPKDDRGLARPTTRQAFQAFAACAFAMAAGQVLSQERWYWAVGTVWWIFVNTTSRGETLVRGFRRLLGTITGILVGLLVAVPLQGAPAPTAALIAVCVFGIFYTAALSYSWMMLCVTVMAGLLYGLLGVLTPALLGLRLAQTGVGALGAGLAVVLILPVTTDAVTNRWVRRALHEVHGCTATAARRLAGDPDADPAPRVAQLEALLGRVRLSLAPLVHPLNPLRPRKERARRVLALLDDCAREARGLAAVAADPEASHDTRLTAACHRVESAVATLVGASPKHLTRPHVEPSPHHPGAEQALAHLQRLEHALTSLSQPLQGTTFAQP